MRRRLGLLLCRLGFHLSELRAWAPQAVIMRCRRCGREWEA